MKTAISLPDAVFERVQRLAERLGMSRSEFFTTAAQRWADELEADELTAAIDDVIERGAEADTEFVSAAARRLLVDDA